MRDDDQGRKWSHWNRGDADHTRKLVVAIGHGSVARGKATVTMRVLHRMTPGQYTVDMVVTLNARKVLSLR